MSGHSHWAGIKYKKAANDAKRGKVWSKLARVIIVAAKGGGGDPSINLSLRYAIDKAKAANMPKDTIVKAIKKGTGEIGTVNFEEVLYEGYALGGVAIMVEALTDNRNRTSSEIKKLMSVAEPYQTIRMRILLALGTGLRRGDIDSLKISDIDFVNNYITTNSKKNRKSMGSRPVSSSVMAELTKYVSELDAEQGKIFNDNFSHKRWKKICEGAGLTDLKFHDLRKTFGSILAQNGISTAVTHKLLEHASPRLTNKVYTNVDPVLRHAVEQLPIEQWLQK